MKNIYYWLPRLLAVTIMLQTLFYKFSASLESVYIFSKIGLEPYGRLGIGILELIASMLLIIRKTSVYGAILTCFIMLGALSFHFGQLGVIVLNDNGKLFALSLITLIASCLALFQERKKLQNSVLWLSSNFIRIVRGKM